MNRRLPPLNLLRGFEAAARHLSFTRAAEEMHITQAAVSQQIKTLEEYLGVPLFQRMTRKLRLTEEGRVLLPVVQEAFEHIAVTVAALGSEERKRTLTVGLEPSFGANWVSPRLGRFWALHPEVDLRLYHARHRVDFSREELELAVRWGLDDWPDLNVEPLMGLAFTPVCSPSLLQGERPLRTPADLRYHTLLHDRDYEGWCEWLATPECKEVNPQNGILIDDTNVVTQAAIDGQGVALCGLALVERQLAEGRLVRPFARTISTKSAYYVIYPPAALKRPVVRDFIDWLHTEVSRDRSMDTP
ncbi:MAG: transcriptional regulator GcvA [Oceanospirillaceae bacterium]|nr:transcriptional regulator GcvA [Oceanospirillaceae bacterium]